jgi:hypothetical protein
MQSEHKKVIKQRRQNRHEKQSFTLGCTGQEIFLEQGYISRGSGLSWREKEGYGGEWGRVFYRVETSGHGPMTCMASEQRLNYFGLVQERSWEMR